MNKLILLIQTVNNYEQHLGKKPRTMHEILKWCEANDMIIGASLVKEYCV